MPRLRDQRTNSAFPVRSLSKDAPDPRTSHSPGGLRALGAALLLTATRADAQIDCRAPLERQDFQISTRDRCDVIPQAERVAASVWQVYVLINYTVQEQLLGGDAVPKYQGEVAGYPVYNGWIVITKNRRLPWIPQTLRDRLDQEESARQRELDQWNAAKASRTAPDSAAQMKTYELLKKTDPAGARRNDDDARCGRGDAEGQGRGARHGCASGRTPESGAGISRVVQRSGAGGPGGVDGQER